MILTWGLAISIYFYLFQPPNNFPANDKADANEYLKIYEYFQKQRDWENVRFAIHNRIVVPFIASTFPWTDAPFSFFIVNTFFALTALLSIYYVMQMFKIKRHYIILILAFFSLHYVGPFRQNAIDPVNVDMPVYLFEVFFLACFLKRRYLLLILVTPIAIATKELFLAIIFVLLVITLIWRFAFNDRSFSIAWLTVTLVVGIAIKLLLDIYFPSATPERNSFLVMGFHLRELLMHPDHLWKWILSLFAAFGGFVFLAFKKWKGFNIRNDTSLIVHLLSLSVLSLSILGGMDYTRLIFLGFPYVILSIFLIAKPNNHEIWAAGTISLLSSRFWMRLPVISLDLSVYNAWMPEWADIRSLTIWTFITILSYFLYLGGSRIFAKLFSPYQGPIRMDM